MVNDSYNILGVSETASDEEIEKRYNELIAKYREDRFLDGEAGNEAARKLTEAQIAYSEILEYRREHTTSSSSSGSSESFSSNSLFDEVDKAIRTGDLKTAQDKLDSFNERPAEWHYLQAVVFYKKKWNNEAKKQLEIAMNMDSGNKKYKEAYDKLIKVNPTAEDADWNHSGNAYSGGNRQTGGTNAGPQMGGNSCFEFCCQMALCNLLLNCCCNCN